jgi:Zn-dependent peptidase ImmA (M78 family)
MLRWARERAGIEDASALARRFPRLPAWEAGDAQPTLRQLDQFAHAVHVPVGYLFLPTPPEEPLPIPDFRTIGSRRVRRPSPDLLDTLYACQERQAWYREYAQISRVPTAAFVGSLDVNTPPVRAATVIRDALAFDLEARANCSTWTDALRLFIRQADAIGILVMVNGVVLSNNRRRLDPDEFRGFALADAHAPLVFINGADTKAAQMFTLAHELAHLWLGVSALSNAVAVSHDRYREEESWCNQVAAELLVPLEAVRREPATDDVDEALPRLARRFKVSTLVVLRRLFDSGRLTRDELDDAWEAEHQRLMAQLRARSEGGDFYLTSLVRLSRRFARAVIENTLEGHTLYRDAFRMLGVSKLSTFRQMGHEAGVGW